MPPTTRINVDLCTGHGCFVPRPAMLGSHNIFVNNLPPVRVTDAWFVHCCGPVCHPSVQATGSSTVFYNNLPQSRIGDNIACTSINAMGSPNHLVGG